MTLTQKEKFLRATLFLLVFAISSIQLSSSFYCTDSYCEEHTSVYNSPCPEPKNCSNTGFRTFLDPDSSCNCCEYCFDYLKENDTCETHSPRKPTEMCGPHLTCVRGSTDMEPGTCQKMILDPTDNTNVNFCMRKRHEYQEAKDKGELGIAQMNPDCDADGFYTPRQCLPGSICYCSDQRGKRVFGNALSDQYQDCACARDVAKLKELGFTGKFPHCLPNGDYDELQCVVRTCFCRSHPETLYGMHYLDEAPCFNPEIHIFDIEQTRYYVKDCELERARVEVKVAEAEQDGSRAIVADVPKCDEDGSYAPIQSRFDSLYCAFPENGTQIDSFGAKKFSRAAIMMNCFCARDRYLLFESANAKPKCCDNGNYRPWQCIGTRCYCVDPMGRQDMTKKQQSDPTKLECYTPPPDGEIEEKCDYEKIYDEYYKAGDFFHY